MDVRKLRASLGAVLGIAVMDGCVPAVRSPMHGQEASGAPSDAFRAWDMAYNASEAASCPQDRWRWIRRGIELLRDEALERKPSNPEAFQLLGWIHQQRLGGSADAAARYCRAQFAREMAHAFGGATDERGMARWELIVGGALTPAELEEQIGKETYEGFAKLLIGQGWTFDDFECMFRESPDAMIPACVGQAITDLGISQRVDLCLRHRWLRNHYRLHPGLILQLDRTFGELDWRLPEAHAIYWAFRASQEWRRREDEFMALQCDRMVLLSLDAAFRDGRLLPGYGRNASAVGTGPNLAVADSCRRSYEASLSVYADAATRGAYHDFMAEAVVCLYKGEWGPRAKQYFEDAKRAAPSRFKGDFHSFAREELAEDVKAMGYNQAAEAIQGCLINSCHALALREYEESRAYERTARGVYDGYQEGFRRRGISRCVPPYGPMKEATVKYCLEQLFAPELAAALKAELAAEKARLEENAPR